MASKAPLEATPLRTLQRYHHSVLNCFGDGETLVDAVQRRPGFYGPNPIAYLSLMARRPSLALGDLDEALINDRALVRAGAFRSSMFLLASEDYPIYFRAFAEQLAESGMGRLRAAGIDENMLQTYARRLREAAFTMSKSAAEVLDIILPARERRPDADVERVLLRKLCDLGVLIRTTSKGWKGNQYNFALAHLWFEDVELTGENPEPARVEVVRRYLRAYGPARVDDIVWWTGLSLGDVRRAVDQLGREAVPFPVDGLGEGLLALRETVDSIRKAQLEQNRILFLPLWDTFPFGWRDRARVVDGSFAPWVYDAAGNAASVILEEGRTIGLWQFRDGDSITLEFHIFEPYAGRLNAVRLAADDHAALLATVAGARDVRVIERALPPALAERPAASFLWPLGKEPVFRVAETGFAVANPMDRRGPNVLRSKFLDDERLVRPTDMDSQGRLLDDEGSVATRRAKAEARSAPVARPAAEPARPAEQPAAKAEPKAAPTKKPAPAKPEPKKAAAKPAAKKPAAKKAPAKKAPAKPAAKKAPAKKAAKPAAKAPAKKPAKKAPAKKPAKKKM